MKFPSGPQMVKIAARIALAWNILLTVFALALQLLRG